MLPRHPDTYATEELESWICHLVDEQVEEGPRLDYKEELDLSDEKGRREAAKDVTSFANGVGGVLLYGIPESRSEDKRPRPKRPFGMTPVPGLESRLENIYVDSVHPNLGEYRIVCVGLSEYQGKVVYLVWTPESWLGPHMVEPYGEHRYYRRGQFRAVRMAEHEVRERYDRTQRLGERLNEFLASPDLTFPAQHFFESPTCGSHYVVTPLMIQDRVDFAGADKRRWLEANPYPNVGWQWVPFQNGVRVPLIERPSGASDHRLYRDFIQLYRCGAISHWSETAGWDEGEVFLIASLSELQKVQDLLLYAGKILNLAGYSGPVRIQGRIRSSKPKLRLAVGRSKDEYPTLLAPDGMVRVFVESPSTEVLNVPRAVLRRVADDMFRAFGRWDASWFFDENGNLRSP